MRESNPALVQVAHTAVKDKKSPYYRLKYEKLVERRGKKRSIIAIARMILTAVFTLLTTGEAWNLVDLFRIDMSDSLKESSLPMQFLRLPDSLKSRDLW